MSSDQPSTSAGTSVRRTTKETHPNLPPGLILDKDGKVCKVCNSWRDWGKTALSSNSSASGSGSTRADVSKSPSGPSGTTLSSIGSFASLLSSRPPSSSTLTSAPPSTSSPALDSAPSSTSAPLDDSRRDCPPDTVALGNATWSFLHTTAAYYPLQARPSTQLSMLRLLNSIGILYPCEPCALDFKEDIQEHPPMLKGREELSRWLCERHNSVNRKLGKPVFECSWERLNQRWKDGPNDGKCD